MIIYAPLLSRLEDWTRPSHQIIISLNWHEKFFEFEWDAREIKTRH